mgnify:CR=1 FL=1
MEQMQKDLETKEFESSVGGGAVVVKANGKKEIVVWLLEKGINKDKIDDLLGKITDKVKSITSTDDLEIIVDEVLAEDTTSEK